MPIQALTQPSTWLILLALGLAAAFYAYRIVRPLRKRDRNHGQTCWLVVGGVAGTIAAYGGLLATITDLSIAVEHTTLLLILFTVSGLPMIFEYVDDHSRRSQEDDQRHILSQINDILTSDDR